MKFELIISYFMYEFQNEFLFRLM